MESRFSAPAHQLGRIIELHCRAKSDRDILNKLAIVEEEADESIYWLELLIETGIVAESKLLSLISDTDEIVAMTVASIKTLRAKINKNPKSKI